MRLEDYRAGQIAYMVYVSATLPEGRQLDLVDFLPTMPRPAEIEEPIDWEAKAAELRRLTEGTNEDHGTHCED